MQGIKYQFRFVRTMCKVKKKLKLNETSYEFKMKIEIINGQDSFFGNLKICFYRIFLFFFLI
jgi:hypothetical protein